MVSFWPPPGSRRWTCMSIRPGATMRPFASMTGTAESFGAAVLSAMRPSTTRRSPTSSRPEAGSMIRPPRIKRELGKRVGSGEEGDGIEVTRASLNRTAFSTSSSLLRRRFKREDLFLEHFNLLCPLYPRSQISFGSARLDPREISFRAPLPSILRGSAIKLPQQVRSQVKLGNEELAARNISEMQL